MKVKSRLAASAGLILLTQFSAVESSSASDLLRALAQGAETAVGTTRIEAPLNGGPATVSYYSEVPCAPTAGAAGPHRVGRRRHVHHRPRRPIAPRPAAAPHPVVAPPPQRPVIHAPPHHRARPHRHHARRPHPPIVAAVAPAPARCLAFHSSQLLRPTAVLDSDLLAPISEPIVDIRPYVAPPLLVDTPPTLSAPLPWINPWSWLPPAGYPGGPTIKGAPEPATWVLMLTGVGAIGAALRRRRRRRWA